MIRFMTTFVRRQVIIRSIPKFLVPPSTVAKLNRGEKALLPATISLLGLSLLKSTGIGLHQVTETADKLFDESKFPELLTHLTHQENWEQNYELLWRAARCKYHLSKKDSKNRVKLLKESLEHINKALEINMQCGPAHKWAAIIIDASSALDGTRARIEQTLNVRKHMEEAIRLMPGDATSYYLLGEWHYSVFMTSWMEKKIASVIFATLPDADLEVALEMFQRAEEIDPGFYSKNLVLLAKTLITLRRDLETAISYLRKVVELYQSSEKWDDVEAVAEAKSLLKAI